MGVILTKIKLAEFLQRSCAKQARLKKWILCIYFFNAPGFTAKASFKWVEIPEKDIRTIALK